MTRGNHLTSYLIGIPLAAAAIFLLGSVAWLGWPISVDGTRLRMKDNMEMVRIPAGEFIMGSAVGTGNADEHPQHSVYLDTYWMDKHEVTNGQFARFVTVAAYRTEAEVRGCSRMLVGRAWQDVPGADWRHPRGPDSDLTGKMEHPVVHIHYDDAKAYCDWAGGRLPTEAEWEKGARGAAGSQYPWGDKVTGERLNFCDRNCEYHWRDTTEDDGYPRTAPVGTFSSGASPYGVLDMSGNVWEWVSDWYAHDYYARTPSTNPLGPTEGKTRVLRGGSWAGNRWGLRATFRGSGEETLVNFGSIGFRCVMD
jgi:formylglycine-generating enzyme required for sulfatase activity